MVSCSCGRFDTIVFWAGEQAKKHNLVIGALAHHISRIRAILTEIRNPPKPTLLEKTKPSDDGYHPDSSDEDLTEPSKGPC